jgi:hypothetical protein
MIKPAVMLTLGVGLVPNDYIHPYQRHLGNNSIEQGNTQDLIKGGHDGSALQGHKHTPVCGCRYANEEEALDQTRLWYCNGVDYGWNVMRDDSRAVLIGDKHNSYGESEKMDDDGDYD